MSETKKHTQSEVQQPMNPHSVDKVQNETPILETPPVPENAPVKQKLEEDKGEDSDDSVIFVPVPERTQEQIDNEKAWIEIFAAARKRREERFANLSEAEKEAEKEAERKRQRNQRDRLSESPPRPRQRTRRPPQARVVGETHRNLNARAVALEVIYPAQNQEEAEARREEEPVVNQREECEMVELT